VNDLQRLVAHEEIRQLAYQYALALDRRDLDLLVSLFVGDPEKLRARFEAQLEPLGVTILFVGNHLIELESAERATGVVYCQARIQEGDRWIEQAIQYEDTYAHERGRWRFVRRNHELWYGVEVDPNPLDQPPANWPDASTGRGTLPRK
jgi:hypothetical protein